MIPVQCLTEVGKQTFVESRKSANFWIHAAIANPLFLRCQSANRKSANIYEIVYNFVPKQSEKSFF
jgi:hypothetical protein